MNYLKERLGAVLMDAAAPIEKILYDKYFAKVRGPFMATAVTNGLIF